MRDEFGKMLPCMKTDCPGPKSLEYGTRLKKHEIPSCSTLAKGETPVFWEKALGSNIEDVDGNIYIDLTSGFAVALAGHSNPVIADAISQQSYKMMHSQGGLNPNYPRVLLNEKLAAIVPGDLCMSFIANTGAEAVDIAIKTARLYTGRNTIIAFQQGFHGKTTGAMAATAINYYRKPFLASITGSTHIPFAYCYRCVWKKKYPSCKLQCAEYLDYILSMPDSGVDDVAAVIMEPIQGHGGWIVPPAGFGKRIRAICDKHNVLLIADEIITGLGRTGYQFGIDYSGIIPDIITMGKALASGFPISAVITKPEIANAWKPMQHSSTFVGNPVGCAAALASLAEIERRGLIQKSRKMGKRFINALKEMQKRHPHVGDARGLGMMGALEFVENKKTKQPAAEFGRRVVELLLNNGIMATNYGGTYHNVLKMSPPLVITQDQLDTALNILDESISTVESSQPAAAKLTVPQNRPVGRHAPGQ